MTNTLFPGRPDYVGPASGWFAMLHHDSDFVEWSKDVMERVEYVQSRKPANEIAVRLHNMIYVGDCPAVAEICAIGDDQRRAIARAQADIFAWVRGHIPDCAWDGEQLVFSEGK